MIPLSAEVWSAVGQVGAFLVAIAALVYAVVSGRSSKRVASEAKELAQRSTTAAERSASAAEMSARAASETAQEMRRSNEARRKAEERQVQAAESRFMIEVALVRGSIRWASGNQVSSGRVLVTAVWIEVANDSTLYPATEVRIRHREHHQDFRTVTAALAPGQGLQPIQIQVKPFETSENNAELRTGTELRFKMAGRTFRKVGAGPPEEVDDQ